MKSLVASAGLAALALASPVGAAQETAPPAAPQQPPQSAEAPAALAKAVDGLHLVVLEDQEGGMASIQNEQGQSALIAFLQPAAAEAARQNPAITNMSISTVPVLPLLQAWEGPIVFEGGAAEVEQANTLSTEEHDFMAPVFMVLVDGKETQINTQVGPVTPILLSHEDAQGMVANLEQQDLGAGNITVQPLEFGAVLQQLNALEEDAGYRFFTHPETVALLQPAQPQANGTITQ